MLAPLVVLAEAGAATFPAKVALLVVLAEAGAATFPALLTLLVVLAPLPYPPLDGMWRRGFRRCRNCWSCQIHDVNGSGSKL